MGEVVDFHTKNELWSIKHTISLIEDLIEECADEEEMKSVDSGLTVFCAKLLIDEIKRKGKPNDR